MEQAAPSRPKGITLVIHSLLPTAFGVLCYVLGGSLLVGAHLLSLNLSGTAFPASFDENLLTGYTNIVIQPLATLVGSTWFNNILMVLLWGVVGWVVCAILAAIAGVINDWRNTEADISTPREAVVVHHPLRRSLVIRLLWRMFIGVCILLFTALITPVVRYCLSNDLVAMYAPSFGSGLYITAFTIFVWAAIFHGYVILLRLYMLRTRIFGEILY